MPVAIARKGKLVYYSQTAVDPSGDCTIWYVGDYLKASATSCSTRTGAVRLPGCGALVA